MVYFSHKLGTSWMKVLSMFDDAYVMNGTVRDIDYESVVRHKLTFVIPSVL